MTTEPTLNDVARTSGVSPATASRALNGRSGVSPEVRDRVLTAAQTLGYRPNRAAQNLAGGRSSVIGLVIGDVSLYRNAYGASLVQAVAKAADQQDVGLMLLLDSKPPTDAVQNLLSDGLIEGLVLSAVAIGHGWVEEILDAKIPTVLIGEHPNRTDVPVVEVDNRQAAQRATEHIFSLGHRRIALLTGYPHRVDCQQRLDGYIDAHQERDLPVDTDLMVHGDYSRISGYELADQLFALNPDAVFAMNDEMAQGIARRASEIGIDIPNEVGLVGFDGSDADPLETPLTSMAQPFEAIGELSVRSLVQLIEGANVPRRQYVPAPLVDRGSVVRR